MRILHYKIKLQRISDSNGCGLSQPNKTQTYHLRPLDQFSLLFNIIIVIYKIITIYSNLILSRLELEYHSYQKCALPVKLKNLILNKVLIFSMSMILYRSGI